MKSPPVPRFEFFSDGALANIMTIMAIRAASVALFGAAERSIRWASFF